MASVTRAWHLRQDGKAFPVNVHLYAMGDGDLISEAEVAAFLIKTDSSDIELAQYVIDAWIALNIEDMIQYDDNGDDIIQHMYEFLSDNGPLGYEAKYELYPDEIVAIHKKLNNFNSVDTLYDFVDNVNESISSIQLKIKNSLNQQFCRVRFGGKYDSQVGNNSIWFRISSVNYNWNNTVYMFVSEMKRKLRIETVTICRDSESDSGFASGKPDYFYKARDGQVYLDMNVNEFLSEEHESSPVFSSTAYQTVYAGVLAHIRAAMESGSTLYSVLSTLHNNFKSDLKTIYSESTLWRYFLNSELSTLCASVNVKLDDMLNNVASKIVKRYSDIDEVDITIEQSQHHLDIIFTLESNTDERLDHLRLSTYLTFDLSEYSEHDIFTIFKELYDNHANKRK